MTALDQDALAKARIVGVRAFLDTPGTMADAVEATISTAIEAYLAAAAPSPAMDEAVKALEPFAIAADSLDIIDYEASVIWGGSSGNDRMILVRDFRRARAALKLLKENS